MGLIRVNHFEIVKTDKGYRVGVIHHDSRGEYVGESNDFTLYQHLEQAIQAMIKKQETLLMCNVEQIEQYLEQSSALSFKVTTTAVPLFDIGG